tara:strand:+ start:1200 stop:2123 length:924 start_codon:yes stop_codon:yes gene_type:complete
MKKEVFIRICPNCTREIIHINKKSWKRSIKKGSFCSSCSSKIVQNDPVYKEKQAAYRREAFKGEGNPFYGKKHSIATRAKMKKIQQGLDKKNNPIYHSKEFKEKSKHVGKDNGMYGKNYYDIWVEKYGKKEANKKMAELKKSKSLQTSGKNNPMYGRPSPQGSGNGWSGWYKEWYFRSLKELSYMINVIEKNNYKWRTAETNDLAIKYVDYNGNNKTYRADFLIEEMNLIEVKPIRLFNTPSNIVKKEAAIIFCKKRGYNYVVSDVKILSVKDIKCFYEKGDIRFIKKYEEKWRILNEDKRTRYFYR